jgi:hypothetical protein
MDKELLGGRSEEEFIDFITDMLITDNALANNILNEYFSDETTECWNFRTSIVVEYYVKKQKKEER